MDTTAATTAVVTTTENDQLQHHDRKRQRRVVGLRLVCFFCLGSSAWILVNGLYAEIPLIVAALDYDYSVISKITLCVTLTSLAPVAWSLWADAVVSMLWFPKQTTTHQEEEENHHSFATTIIGISLILALAVITSLCLALTDAATHETTLLVASVGSGMVGTMSRVLYFPHASTTHAIQQTTSMASGIGVGSLIVAVLAIAQQAGENKDGSSSQRFSIQTYFGIVTGLIGVAVVGFAGTLVIPSEPVPVETNEEDEQERTLEEETNYTAVTPMAKENPESTATATATDINSLPELAANNAVQATQDETQANLSSSIQNVLEEEETNTQHQLLPSSSSWSSFLLTFVAITRQHAVLNAGQFLLNALTFFLPGIVPYSVQHFEHSQRALHYLTVTQLIGQTLGAMASGWKQYRQVGWQLGLFTVLWLPTVILSFVNNESFQESNQLHSAVPITLNAMLNFVYGYSSTTFYHLVHADAAAAASVLPSTSSATEDEVLEAEISDHENNSHDEGYHENNSTNNNNDPHVASRVLGSWNQLGAMLGSLVAYALVENGAIS